MWGKILAGAVVGVGAVASAPFTGGGSLLGGATILTSLAGAGTIAAAVGLGAAGATVGSYIADTDKEDGRREGKIEGKNEADAEHSIKMNELDRKLSDALGEFQLQDDFFNAIIALEAVGVACAACDGDFSDNEKEEIGEFVKGMLEQNIPNRVKEKLKNVYDNPPNIKDAFELAKHSGIPLKDYEELISFVVEIDGIKEEEKVFIAAWKKLADSSSFGEA